MALPQASDMNKYNGSKFSNTDWDGNVDSTVSFLSSGNYDLKVGDIDCAAINAASINLPATEIIPKGTVMAYSPTEQVKPDGWEICDGRNLDIATNEELFYLLGGAHGMGDATTWFCSLLYNSGAPYPVGQFTPISITNDIMNASFGGQGTGGIPTLSVGDYVAVATAHDNAPYNEQYPCPGYKILSVEPAPSMAATVSVAGMYNRPDLSPAYLFQDTLWTTMTTFTLPDYRGQILVGGSGVDRINDYPNAVYQQPDPTYFGGKCTRNDVHHPAYASWRRSGAAYIWSKTYSNAATQSPTINIEQDTGDIGAVTGGEYYSVQWIIKL